MDYFVLVSGNNAEFNTVRLASVQLAAKSGGMGIWSVAPGCMETSLDVDFFLVGDFEPCAEVGEEGEDGLVFEGNVVLFFVVNILVVNGSNHILNADGVDGLLKFILLPKEFVLIFGAHSSWW